MSLIGMFSSHSRAIADIDPDEILADSVSVFGSGASPEGKLERPIGPLAYVGLFIVVGIGCSALLASAFFLQVYQGDRWFAASQENRFFTRVLNAPRGIVYDRFRAPLVDNLPSYGLLLEREELMRRQGDLLRVTALLGELLAKPPRYFEEAGIPVSGDPKRMPPYLIVAKDLSDDEIVRITARLDLLPGVRIFESFRRTYGDPYAFSHLLGFVGKVSEEDLARLEGLGYEDAIGKSGLEAFYDDELRGRGGRKIIEVDAAGREGRFKLVEEPKGGAAVATTIDGGLQKKAYEVFEHYAGNRKSGSVVILDPQSGAVRALVSYPGFDSNKFGYALTNTEFNEVVASPLKPLFNRAIAGEFPSGSTIKPFFAAAALSERIIDPEKKIYDPGYIAIPNPYKPGEETRFVDWRPHGWVNFYDAIALSANVYFYIIGGGYRDQPGLGIWKLKEYANAFGMGSILGIDLPGEKDGFFPDPDTKPLIDPGNPMWRVGDTYNVSIGQGGVKATPLQIAAATAAIANGGRLYRPWIVEGIERGDIRETRGPFVIRDGVASPEALKEVRKGMRQTVTAGTARSLQAVPVAVAAKTGTAQAGSGLPHALVTVFAPAENPEIAAVVMVEHAGEGSTVAVPIMRDILQWYFSRPSVGSAYAAPLGS